MSGLPERRRTRPPVVVPVLIAANIAVYVWLGAQGVGWIDADGRKLIESGSLFGPLTTGGQWWRLATALFLHGSLVHIAVNMIALYDMGNLCERFFGRARFALVYFASGLVGSAASLWWNPVVNSVGASGAIFGVYGALLAFVLDRRNGVDWRAMQTHVVSVIVFVGYSLVNGFLKSGIDNAAHIGGLIGGIAVGWALARPIGELAPAPMPLKAAAGLGAAAIAIAVLIALTPNTHRAYEAHKQFDVDLAWFQDHENEIVAETKTTFAHVRTGKDLPAVSERRILAIAERWKEAHGRFAAYRLDPRISSAEAIRLHQEIVTYTDVRRRAMVALARTVKAPPREQTESLREFDRLWKEGTTIAQRIKERNEPASEKRAK